MSVRTISARIPVQGVLAAIMTLAVLFSVTTTASRAQAAEPAGGAAAPSAAYEIIANCGSGGWVPTWDGPQVNARTDGRCRVLRADSAQAANTYVHNYCYGDSASDQDGFCTIQKWGGQYYVYEFWGCDAWDLRRFGGRWETHNHGELSVWFYDQQKVIIKFWPGRSVPLTWDPIWSFKTCA